MKRSPALEKLLQEKSARRKVKDEKTVKVQTVDDEFEDENIASDPDDEEPSAAPTARAAVDVVPVIKIEPEDDLIRRLKEAGYSDSAVAKYLAEQAKVIYRSKQIANRWARLRRTLGSHNDELMKAGLTGWHNGDDEILQQAMVLAKHDEREAIARAKAKKWQRVADHVKNLRPVTNFSPEACKNRAAGLNNGTANPTPESCENPDQKTLTQIQLRKELEAQIETDRALKPSMFKPEHEVDEMQ